MKRNYLLIISLSTLILMSGPLLANMKPGVYSCKAMNIELTYYADKRVGGPKLSITIPNNKLKQFDLEPFKHAISTGQLVTANLNQSESIFFVIPPIILSSEKPSTNFETMLIQTTSLRDNIYTSAVTLKCTGYFALPQ